MVWGCSTPRGTGFLNKIGGIMKKENYVDFVKLHREDINLGAKAFMQMYVNVFPFENVMK